MVQNNRTVVETVSLTKVFKDFWGRDKVRAVDNLNFEIQQGEVLGLLGPNGSGKTTTIKMLLGLLYPTRGRATIFGQSPSDVGVKSRIGYLPEETRLYQFLDSHETLDFYGRLFQLAGDERSRRGAELVDMVGLSAAASRPVGQYSKGMARRIGLAQSLINDPDFLILDEPTSGLDPIGTRQIKDLILALKKRGKTILLSSHLLGDVEDVCDRVAIMYGGRLLCLGPVHDLLAQQDMTQIVSDRLSPEQSAEVQKFIEERFGTSVISVGAPKDRLEQFFLRMVEQAQKQYTTHGALAGGEVSAFLRKDAEGAELLSELTSKEDVSAAVEAQKRAEAKAEQSRRDREQAKQRAALDALTEDAAPAETSTTSESAVRDVKPQKAQVDRSLLDGLSGDDAGRGA